MGFLRFTQIIIGLFFPNRGQALVDVLLGYYNPSGRLPITYPKYNHHLSTYDYKWAENDVGNSIDVEFEFGHGLSYTSFTYSNLNVPLILSWNHPLNVTVVVRNSGSRSGNHTVLLYISDIYRSVTPPNKELKGFKRVFLQAGEQIQVGFTLNLDDLSFIGIDLIRKTEPGLFTVTVGTLKANFTLNIGDDITTPRGTSESTNHQYSFFLINTLLLLITKMI